MNAGPSALQLAAISGAVIVAVLLLAREVRLARRKTSRIADTIDDLLDHERRRMRGRW
ncbi:MAG: hypothetical protein ACQGVC_18135 [Myxococcota bacterium]